MVERATPEGSDWVEHGAPHVARYLFAAEHAQGRRVLDAGCGAGYGSRLLAEAGAAEVVAVDLDAEAVDRARRQYGAGNLKFQVDDCQELATLAGRFDLICNFEAIEHFADPKRFLKRAAQLLAPDGLLMISTPDRAATPPFVNGKPRNPFHLVEWYRDEFVAILSECFAEVELRTQVQSLSLRSRQEAVAALRQGLTWCNPLAAIVWRKWPFGRRRRRPWKQLAGLAAPSIADYPIVPLSTASLYGESWFHFALCRRPNV
jgi:SAM-dependent methyltransferase